VGANYVRADLSRCRVTRRDRQLLGG